jgi:NHL repeat-containing protein
VRSEAKAPLRTVLLASLLAPIFLSLSSGSALAATNHVLTDSFGSPGSGNGQLKDPEGIALDESTGDVYVADTGNRRVSKFDADGDFLLSWGIDVVKSGPDNGVNEHQSVTAEGSGGTFTLRAPNGFDESFNSHQTIQVRAEGGTFTLVVPNSLNTTAPHHWQVSPGPNSSFSIQVTGSSEVIVPHDASAAELQAAIEKLKGFSGNVASVTGPVAGPWEVTFKVGFNAGSFSSVGAGNGGSILVGQETAPIARNASATEVQAPLQALSAIGAGNVSVSGAAGGPWDVEFKGVFAGKAISSLLGVNEANLTGSPKSAAVVNGQMTAPIARNASAAEVQAALEALSAIGAGNVSVSGSAGGPWDVEFKGIFAQNDVPQLIGDKTDLTGEPKSVAVATTTFGGGFEICKAGVDTCKAGAETDGLPRMVAPTYIAVDNSGGPSDGAVYVEDLGSGAGESLIPAIVEKFTSNATYIWANDGSASGSQLSAGNTAGVVVDSSGDWYVGGIPNRASVSFFTEDGVFKKSLALAEGEGLAVDSTTGSLFINTTDEIFKIIKVNLLTKKFSEVGDDPTATNIGLDPTSSALYATFKTYVKRYDPSQNTVNLQEEFGKGDLSSATAIALLGDEFATAYVTDAGSDEVKVFSSPILPDPKTLEIEDLNITSATLNGTINPNGLKASYQFEYVEESVFQKSGFAAASKIPIPAGDAGDGEAAIAVSEAIEGLEPGTTYRWRLAAANGLASAVGATKSFTTPSPVELSDLYPSGVGTTSAVANATINPGGAKTTYRVEYGTSEAYGKVAPVPDASAGSGTADLKVSQALQGLKSDTTYHFRFVAENVGGPVISEDETFRTFAVESPELPDERAWEMVSPPDKNGGSVATRAPLTRVAADGDAIAFPSMTAFADSLGTNGNGNEYISRRTPEGWETHGITPLQIPNEFPFFSSGYVGELSADLDRGTFLAFSTLEAGHPNVEGTWNIYGASDLLTPGGASFQLLSDSVNPPGEPVGSGEPPIKLAAASADLSHVIFETRANLTADALSTDPALPKLYEWADGELRLAGILPDGACGSPPCVAAGSIAGRGATEISILGGNLHTYTTHTISADGSRVFFTAPPFSLNDSSGFGKFGSLYLREDGASTVKLNASERSMPDPAGAKSAKFLDATPDGDYAFFVSAEQLTDEDDNSGHDIYRYEVDAPEGSRLTLVSEDANPVGGQDHAGYVIGTSEDGSYVYFTGQNELVAGQPSSAENADSDKYLYVWHEGEVRFVGAGPPVTTSWATGSPENHWGVTASTVTPDGKRIVFASVSSELAELVAGFENENTAEICAYGGPATKCQQIYTYGYDSDELECVSCNSAGEAVRGQAFSVAPFVNSSASGSTSQHITRTISDDGRWVFFSSPDRLVARDNNGLYDAYRYDTTTGRVALLSSGSCNCDSYFVEISPDGKDAFFTTREQLVEIDFDEDADLYDARVGGGIAAQNAVPKPQCEGDACIPPAAVPNFPTPASAGFKGQGNVKTEPSKRCRAGKVRRGKRCVSKRSGAKRACRKRKGEAKRRCAQRTNRNRGGGK